jgi:hypothetical protein
MQMAQPQVLTTYGMHWSKSPYKPPLDAHQLCLLEDGAGRAVVECRLDLRLSYRGSVGSRKYGNMGT